MSFYTLLDDGKSIANAKTWKGKILFAIGRWLVKHPRVHLGKNVLIHPGAKISPRDGEIYIGDNTYIAAGTYIQGNVTIGSNCSININGNVVGYGNVENKSGLVSIGDNTRIAANVMMIAANHNFDRLDVPICKQGLTNAPIAIGPNVWLGGYVKITAGCSVGEGSVVGMGSVVTKNIPENSVAVGVPAKVIKSRKDQS